MSACLFYIQCQSIPVWPYFSIRANGQNRTVIFNPQTGALTIVLHSLLSETVHLSYGGFTTPKWARLTCYWFCNLTKPLSYVESYARHILFIMSLRSDSNQRLTHYKCVVLPTVLRRQVNTTRQISQWGSDRFLMFPTSHGQSNNRGSRSPYPDRVPFGVTLFYASFAGPCDLSLCLFGGLTRCIIKSQICINRNTFCKAFVAGIGFEPTTFRL